MDSQLHWDYHREKVESKARKRLSALLIGTVISVSITPSGSPSGYPTASPYAQDVLNRVYIWGLWPRGVKLNGQSRED
jgi:hypothetical protein